jgi:hypothetical protein
MKNFPNKEETHSGVAQMSGVTSGINPECVGGAQPGKATVDIVTNCLFPKE